MINTIKDFPLLFLIVLMCCGWLIYRFAKIVEFKSTYSHHYLIKQLNGNGKKIFEHNNTDWITAPYEVGDTVYMDLLSRGFSKYNSAMYLDPFVILEIETKED